MCCIVLLYLYLCDVKVKRQRLQVDNSGLTTGENQAPISPTTIDFKTLKL